MFRKSRQRYRNLKRVASCLLIISVASLANNFNLPQESVSNILIIGFYQRDLLSIQPSCYVTNHGDRVLPLNLASFNGTCTRDRQLEALQDLKQQLVKNGWEFELFPHTLVVGVHLEATSSRASSKYLRTIPRHVFQKLRRGKVFTQSMEACDSFPNFVTLFKNIQHGIWQYEVDSEHLFFCPTWIPKAQCDGSIYDAVQHVSGAPKRLFQDVGHSTPSNCQEFLLRVPLRAAVDTRIGKDGVRPNRRFIHVWINDGKNLERRQAMEREIHAFASAWESNRFEAISVASMTRMLLEGTLKGPFGRNHDESFLKKYQIELACTMSHLSAILYAYHLDADVALITEDDVRFPVDFVDRLENMLVEAPQDWETLQLLTVNPDVVHKLAQLYTTRFVKWYPPHWSTAAYVINRRGMMKVLETLSSFGEVDVWNMSRTSWRIPRDAHVADEVIYNCTVSYSAVNPSISLSRLAMKSSIQEDGKGMFIEQVLDRPQRRMHGPQSLLVVTVAHIQNEVHVEQRIELAAQNLRQFRIFVPRVSSRLFIVCDTNAMARKAEDVVLRWQSNQFNISIDVIRRRFNKYDYIAQAVSMFDSFQKLVIMDSDIRLVGFPVVEFLELVERFVIGGTVQQNARAMLSSKEIRHSRRRFEMFDGAWWMLNAPDVLLVETSYLEPSFVIMDTGFATWMFSRVVSDEVLIHTASDKKSDCGPDLLWCGAASEWLARTNIWWKRPCALSTYPIEYLDDRQLGVQVTQEADLKANAAKSWIPTGTYERAVPHWFKFSSYFIKQTDGRVQSRNDFKQSLLGTAVRSFTALRSES